MLSIARRFLTTAAGHAARVSSQASKAVSPAIGATLNPTTPVVPPSVKSWNPNPYQPLFNAPPKKTAEELKVAAEVNSGEKQARSEGLIIPRY